MSSSPRGESTSNLTGVDTLLQTFRHTGSASDFEQIVKRFGALVFNECRRVTGNSHDAEDAAQLTLLAFAIELRSGTNLHRPIAWLQRVSRRQSLKILRAHGRRKRREDAVRRDVATIAPEQNGAVDDQALTASLVRDAIDALPDRYRLPLVLHYFGGMSMESIANELALSKTAVGTRLHRARKLVADQLSLRGLSFDAGTLTTAIASLVPLAVVSNLVTSASVGPGSNIACIAASTNLMWATSSHLSAPRIVAAAVLGMGLGGTALGWRPVVEQIRQKVELVVPMLDRIFAAPEPISTPRFTARSLHAPPMPTPVWSTEGIAMATAPAPGPAHLPSSRLTQTPPQSGPIASPRSPEPTSRTQPDRPDAPRAQFQLPVAPPETWQRRSVQAASAPGASQRSPLPRIQDRSSGPLGIILGNTKGQRETRVQTGGEVRTGPIIVGDAGEGRYELRTGRLETPRLAVGARRHSHGVLQIEDGEVVVTDPLAPIEVGAQGAGYMLLGSSDAPGRLVTADGTRAQLIVRSTQDARGVIRGWGDVRSGGTIINNGRIIADGFHHLRSLDFTSFTSVTNTIDNPRDGISGWYAQRGGRVRLPAIRIEPGAGTYTWGESTDDPTIDLVNSLRFTVYGQEKPASLAIALRTIAAADPLDIPIPQHVSVFGLWEFSGTGFDPEQMSVIVRYNAESTSSFGYGESALRLLGYTESGWTRADGTWLDLSNRLIGGDFGGCIHYLAVAMEWGMMMDQALEPSRSANEILYFRAASIVPEPAFLLPAIAGLMLPRRRMPA